jgi:delta1-piperideine-2-carboxylate reductase
MLAAKEFGIAIVDTHHLSALWPEVEALAEEGLVSLAWTASLPCVAPAGGSKPLYGTNPFAFGWPRSGRPPLIFDQASALTARGELMILAENGSQAPVGAGIDRNGCPTTDPKAILEGAQLAFGGYKGASLALMVELLAGPLIGEFLSFEAEEYDAGAGAAPHGGELIVAMDPRRFGNSEGFSAQAERLFEAVLAQKGTRLPGERRLQSRRATLETGISIPRKLYDTITELSIPRS